VPTEIGHAQHFDTANGTLFLVGPSPRTLATIITFVAGFVAANYIWIWLFLSDDESIHGLMQIFASMSISSAYHLITLKPPDAPFPVTILLFAH
jgi:hypothetical protein